MAKAKEEPIISSKFFCEPLDGRMPFTPIPGGPPPADVAPLAAAGAAEQAPTPAALFAAAMLITLGVVDAEQEDDDDDAVEVHDGGRFPVDKPTPSTTILCGICALSGSIPLLADADGIVVAQR